MRLFEKTIFFFAEKGKLSGRFRLRVKQIFYPLYRLYCSLRWKIKDELYLYHVELPVTLRCSLKCRHCVFMMTKFEDPHDFDVEDLLSYMDILFSCVDSVQIFRILGGEPFLYNDLPKIISRALSYKAVKTVEVVTNGTVVPSENVFDVMKNSRITVQISDYGKYSRNKDRIKAICESKGIKCVLRTSEKKTWNDAGDLHFRGRSKMETKKQLRKCSQICRELLDGRLYYCSRSAFGTKLNLPDMKADYVSLSGNISREELRRQIYQLNQKRFLYACNYCDQGTANYIEVPVAEQLIG